MLCPPPRRRRRREASTKTHNARTYVDRAWSSWLPSRLLQVLLNLSALHGCSFEETNERDPLEEQEEILSPSPSLSLSLVSFSFDIFKLSRSRRLAYA